MESILIETNDPEGPFGAKGMGEASLLPTSAAIANAIYDAIGVRLKELPFTPDKIIKALKEKEQDFFHFFPLFILPCDFTSYGDLRSP